MDFQIFAKENCDICVKAKQVLNHIGIEPKVRYVEGPQATAANLADLAWFDWVDKPPLVVVTEGDKVIKRWTGDQIASNKSWTEEVCNWLKTCQSSAQA
ncbi:MAG: glutaredoxin domain-containing protein [candidate division WOR-3 bacterium]